jgi:NAD(P)-dependent dehydrogenase (short-subunit alcohol dehydrogenase family)
LSCSAAYPRIGWITGAAGGIGTETARLFAAEGAIVAGADLAEHTVGDLALRVDVTDEAQVAGMYARVREQLGRVDVLFNNAGIAPPTTRLCSRRRWRRGSACRTSI